MALTTPEDSAWKDILDQLFPDFLEFFFPEIHRDIDWSRGYESLKNELQPILLEAEVGKQVSDTLVKVHLLDGSETWVLIHVEVQGQPEAGFARRMFDYNARIGLRYGREVVSLAVLTDPSEGFRPDRYERCRWGFKILMEFPKIKIIDYEKRMSDLEKSLNPFSIVVLTHLEGRKAKTEEDRFDVKFRLVRRLYSRGYVREDVIALLRFIDWLVRISKDLNQELQKKIETELEGVTTMPYLSSWERYAMEKGMEEGLEKGMEKGMEKGLREGLIEAISFGLKHRFGDQGLDLLAQVRKIENADRLRTLADALYQTESVEDFIALLGDR